MNRQMSTTPIRPQTNLVILLGILAASCTIVLCIGSVTALWLLPKINALGSPSSTRLPQAAQATVDAPSPMDLPQEAQAAVDAYAKSRMYKSFRIVQVNGRGKLPQNEETYEEVECVTVHLEDSLFGQTQTRGVLVVREESSWYIVFPDKDAWQRYSCPGVFVSPD